MATPRPAAMWPLTISAGVNDKINLVRGGAFTATVAAGTYYTPTSLAAAVQAALTAAVANAWSVGVNGSQGGKVFITGTSAFQFLFATGANAATSCRDVLGFGAVDTVSGTSVLSANQHQNAWYADDPVMDDTGDLPLHERSQGVAIAGPVKSLHHATRYTRAVQLGFLEAWKWRASDEGSTHLNEAIERLIESGWSRFRWFPDQTLLGTGTDYVLALDTAKTLPRDRLAAGTPLYSLPLRFLRYV